MRSRLGSGPLTLPGLGWLVLFFIVPLAIIFVVSLGTRDRFGGVILDHVSLDNYRTALSPEFLPTVWNSFRYAGLTAILSIAIGYPVAYWISRHGGSHKALLLILVMLPFWTSYLIRTYAWMIILRDNGVVNSLLQAVGLTSEPIILLNTDLSVVLGMTYGFLPFAILPLFVSIDRLDDALIAAARDLYASGRSAFLHVTLPLTMPGIIAAANADVHSGHRGLRHARSAGRRPDDHDRQDRPGPVPVGTRLAERRGPGLPVDAGHDRRHAADLADPAPGGALRCGAIGTAC